MTPTDEKARFRLPRDLGLRLASGLVLAAVALGLTWLGGLPFAGLVLAVALIVAWEWGRVVRKSDLDMVLAIHALSTLASVALAAAGAPALGFLAVLIGAILAAVKGFGGAGPVSAIGVLYSGLPAVALIWLRSGSLLGREAVLFLFLLVWIADTGAYVFGRTIGGPKLSPRISPNKTWAGLIGGVAVSGAAAALASLVLTGASPLRLAASGLVLAFVAQCGDLMESALKREHGVKDASHLIPGHGGFMDRVDGLILAAIAAGLFALVVNVHNPGRALLYWY